MQFELGSEGERRLLEELEYSLGKVVLHALADPHCEDVALNPDGRVWKISGGEEFECVGTLEAGKAEGFLKTLASYHHEPIDKEAPLVNLELPPHGYRVGGVLPPHVRQPLFVIRKPSTIRRKLIDYVEQGAMNGEHYDLLRRALQARRNILVSGGTGSGKTTLTMAMLDEVAEVCPRDRVIVIEDTTEISCTQENHAVLRAKGAVGIGDLVRQALRLRPKRIVVGEVRGPEALYLLDAWGTAHPGGVSTVHANSAVEALGRIEDLVSRNAEAPSDTRIPAMVRLGVDLVVQIAETRQGRRIKQIVEVLGHGPEGYQVEEL